MNRLSKACFTLIAASLISAVPVWSSQPVTYAKGSVTASQVDINRWVTQAINKLAEVTPEIKEYTRIEIRTGSDSNANELIEVYLHKSEKEKLPMITLELDPRNGEIVTYYTNTGEKNDGQKPDPQVARENAKQFLKQLLGEDANSYQLADEGNQVVINLVAFIQVINGIPFSYGGINVFVNQKGKVTGFSKSFTGYRFHDPAVFPKPDNTIGENKALEQMANSLRLVYLEGTESGNDPALIYVPEMYWQMDAVSGKILSSINVESNKYSPAIAVASQGVALYAKSRKEAEALLKSELGVEVKGLTYNEQSVRDSKVYMWTNDKGTNLQVIANTKSGKVSGLIANQTNKNSKPKITRAKAQDVAVQFLQKYLDKEIKGVHIYDMNPAPSSKDSGVFLVNKSYQGIPVQDYQVEVLVDLTTGKVKGIQGLPNRPHVDLPDSKQAISLAKAAEVYMQNHAVELIYTLDGNEDKTAEKPVLAYQFKEKNAGYIDAISGTLKPYPKMK